MKFLLFADLHYAPTTFMGGTWEDLALLQRRAEETGCEMIVHAGDFCHGPNETEESRRYTAAYNDFHIPSYHCLGNHDCDRHSVEETLRLYKMPNDYYFFDQGGYRFVLTNTSYYKDGDEYVLYDHGNYFQHPETRETMPPEEIVWLKETVETSPYPCIILSHASLERPDGVKNRDEILAVIDAANRKKPHSVLMCVNGHHHRDYVRIRNGVLFFEMNSASYDWIEKTHDLYPAEECEKMRNHNHTVVYNDCLYAIVTLEGTTVKIEGMESSMYRGVTREMAGCRRYDGAGREVTPTVQSATIIL